MNRLGLAGAAAVVLCAIVGPASCGGDPFALAPGAGNDGGSSGSSSGSSSGDDGGPPHDGSGSGGDDGHGDDGSSGGGPDGPLPADAPHEAPPGSIVYVSPTGADTNDGTDPSKPRKTIAGGLSRAQGITNGPEVHVCKGTYVESSLTMSQTLQLLGSFDCTTWKRTATYGYPSFDGTNASVVENGNLTAQAATLIVTGAVAPSATIDGFAIVGATTASSATAGVEVAGSASPILSNDQVSGGAGIATTGSNGSIGVAIIGGSPEIKLCEVSGGSGTGKVGSAGVAVNSTGTPYLHDAVVSGGTGTAATPATDIAAIGVLVASSMTQANAIKAMTILGSDEGPSVSPNAGSTVGVGVFGTGVNLDLQSSVVRGGNGTGGGTFSAGVDATATNGTVRVLGDRIYGGNRAAGGSTYGVFVGAAGAVAVNNCEIHAGTTTGAAVGVNLSAGTSSTIYDDTIYASGGTGGAIEVQTGVTGVSITDDLLLGANGATQVAVAIAGCTGSQLTALDYTAFSNWATLYQCGSTSAITVPSMAAALPSTPTAGDVEIGSLGACSTVTASCAPDPSCPAASPTCIPSILGSSWTSTDDGVGGLFGGASGSTFKGWTLPAGTLCVLARGGTPLTGITADVFGQTRSTVKPTIGAFEYTSATCN